jgi:hypothetical protein
MSHRRLIRLALLAAAAACPTLAADADAQPPGSAGPVEEQDPDLVSQLQALEEDASSLQLYGFADFTYTHFLMDGSSRWFDYYFSRYPSFAIGNLNLYLEKQLSPRWKSLIEFRLLYLPNGTEKTTSTGEVEQTDTSVLDYQDKTEYLRWGGISIERAWIEYQAHALLTIRAGQWLTKYGIWNVDHGSPVLISIRRPFIIGLALFPRSQTGLELYGTRAFGDSALTYHVTVSNGRGPVDTYLDLDYNKAIGGRLMLDTPWLDEFKLGASAYTGTYSARTRSYGLRDDELETADELTERYRELALAADLRARSGPLILHAEFISRQAVYDDRARPMVAIGGSGQQSDYLAYGGYVQTALRLPWFGLMPYASGEYLRPQWRTVPAIWVAGAGINMRVTPSVTLKTQLQTAFFPEVNNIVIPEEAVRIWEAQVAWAF